MTVTDKSTLKPVMRTPGEFHYFFGYYDRSPLNGHNSRLLAQRVPFINRMPHAGEEIEIGYFAFPAGGGFNPLARTAAWNWQQGSTLQWLGPDFSSRIIYNDIRDGDYRAIIRRLESGEETILPMPVYAVARDGKSALCVDYDRLFWIRPGYSYRGRPRPEKNKPYDPDDGIWRMSLEDGSCRKIISLREITRAGRVGTRNGGRHYLEHLMINPADSRFAFLHRWRNIDGGIFSRLFSAGLDGEDLCLLNDSGRMSHFCWRDERWIFGYGGSPTVFNRLWARKTLAGFLVRPLLPAYHKLFPSGGAVSRRVTGDSYQLFRDLSAERVPIPREVLPDDGHPTFRPGDRGVIVNDTYPDERGDCRLYLFQLDEGRVLDRITIASDPAVRETGYRCDLHPKWSRDGRYVCVDTCSKNGRGMTVFDTADEAAGICREVLADG